MQGYFVHDFHNKSMVNYICICYSCLEILKSNLNGLKSDMYSPQDLFMKVVAVPVLPCRPVLPIL